MTRRKPPLAVIVTAIVIAILGLASAIGGIWLGILGGSWYYLAAGVLFLLTAYFLMCGSTAALWTYALLVIATLVWAVWEVGFDWWGLAPRGDVVFIVGLFLLAPWITRPLRDRSLSPSHAPSMALGITLVIALIVGVIALFQDPHRITGELPVREAAATPPADAVPAGEWHAYGRTGMAQRYSPLDQITPENVGKLEVAWTYHTGDIRGPGDPVETTYEVTPLKIGNRLFLCTPHQYVIALDADTGKEIWRYDPKVQGKLALQHLTCRGLSYHPATATGVSEPGATTGQAAPPAGSPAAPTPGAETAVQPAPQQPVQPADQSGEQPTAAPDQPQEQAKTQADPGLPNAADGAKTAASCPAKLFMPTADGRIIALDPKTGAVCLDFADRGQINLWTNMPNVNPGGYYSTSAPVVAANLIVVGGTVLDNVSTHETSGVIRAYDVNTGRLVWNWDSGNPDVTTPLPPGQKYTANSPNSWSTSAVDEQLGMVYVPMGNQPPDQWGGRRSPAVEKYSSSVVALDLKTGQVRWVFQTVHHDLWDYDVPAQPSLIDLTIGGETVPALVQPTKQGELYVLDRRTGKPVLPVTEKPAPQGAAKGDHTAPTQPVSAISFEPPPLTEADMWGATMFDQLACRISLKQMRYEGRYTPPSEQGTIVYPGNFGVFNWGGIAVDPVRQVAFTMPTYLAFISKLVPRENDTKLYVQEGNKSPQGALPALNENFGAPFAVILKPFLSPVGLPCQEPPWGYVAGADLTTGKIVWKHRNGTVRDRAPIPLPFRMGVPGIGGPMMTKGGVAFLSGTIDYYVRGYDVTSGKQLWEARLPAGGQATPMTYMGEDGRQYLLVVAGGHGSLGTKAGDSIIAYALPKNQ